MQLVKGFYTQFGLDGISSHSGRRYFMPKLAHSGMGGKIIMVLAGHQHFPVTQRYIGVNDEMVREAVEIL